MTPSWRGREFNGESRERISGPCRDQGGKNACESRTSASSDLLAAHRQALVAPPFTSAPTPRPEVNPAYAVIDASRAVLASVVAFSHAWYLVVRDYQPGDGAAAGLGYFIAGFAHACVVIFFVLSGYWITRSVSRRLQGGWSWKHYLADRLVRLELVLIPALVLGGALDAIGYYGLQTATHLAQTDTFVLRADLASTLNPEILLANLVFLQGIVVLPFGSNGPLWSVGYEFWYYLWFPALALSVRRRRPSWSLAFLLVGLWSAPLATGFICWLCGSAVYAIERRWSATWSANGRRPRLIAAAAVVGAAMILFLVRFIDFPFEDVVLAAAFAGVLAIVLMARVGLPPMMTRIARYGAQSSFTLYAVHFPVMALAAGIVVEGSRLHPDIAGVTWVGVLLTGSILIAGMLSRLTEARTAEVRNWLSTRISF